MKFVDREIQTLQKIRWPRVIFVWTKSVFDAEPPTVHSDSFNNFSGYTHDYNFDLVILLSTMGLFVFLLVVEMLLELRLIRKYSRFQLPEEYDIVTKVKFKYRQ